MTELNLAEIREYMLKNNCKVTNHALVKHFKKFLTNVETQDEARRKFKTYVNILATIKNENGEKYLVLRKKFINEVPIEDPITAINTVGLPPVSPSQAGSRSSNSSFQSEFDTFSPQVGARQPPPYRPPPEVLSPAISNHSLNMSQNSSTSLLTPGNKLPFLEAQTEDFYRECVDEFQIAMNALKERDREKKLARQNSVPSLQGATPPPPPPPIMRQSSVDVPPPTPPKKLNLSRENSLPNEQKTPSTAEPSPVAENKENVENESDSNKISVKEAMQKFNRFASEEEAKIPSPIGKVNKKIDECDQGKTDEDDYALNLMQHPKAKEWIISACKGDYQKMSKLAKEFPVLVKLKEPNSNALHWASKQGNSDVVKLVAGTYKLDVNERTNGGYTALHIAIQHGKVDIFELLSNVYKADRNLTDWYGKKPLEYQQKQTKSVSSSTYSSEYYDDFNSQKFDTFPVKIRRGNRMTASFAKPRPLSSVFESPKNAKVRRNRTMLASSSKEVERNASFSSQDSSSGAIGPKKEVTNLEDIFHVNPKKRFEKKYRSMIKKKFDKTFPGTK